MANYVLIDFLTQGYLILTGLIILLAPHDSIPLWKYLLLAHLLCIGLIHLLIRAYDRSPSNRVLRFLRHFYPIILYTGFYRETGALNQIAFNGFLDPVFIRLEQKVFHFQPSVVFMDSLSNRWIAEIFYAAYFSYYIMIFGIGLILFLKDYKKFFHYLTIVSFVFYLCYLTYIFTPVTGPRLFYREIASYKLPQECIPQNISAFPESVQKAVFYKIMDLIYDIFESPGAAFPSSHVAIAICTLYFSIKYIPSIRYLHLIIVIILCLSTVYCRYHYAIDVIAGALTAGILTPVGNLLYEKWGKLADNDS
jgi:membrane-associated phospholipid phosphatase